MSLIIQERKYRQLVRHASSNRGRKNHHVITGGRASKHRQLPNQPPLINLRSHIHIHTRSTRPPQNKIPDSKVLARKIAISAQKTNTEIKRKESHHNSPPEINHSIPNSTDPCPDTGDCKLPPNTRTSTGQC